MKSTLLRRWVFVLALLLASPCFAWSYKEHILFTRMAVMRILNDPTAPQPMKSALRTIIEDVPDMAKSEDFFLHTKVGDKPSGFYGLSYWCYMPDEHARFDKADSKVDLFGEHEKQLHFIDLEMLLSGTDRGYKHDLSNKPKLADIPRDMKDERYVRAGMLPFRVEQCYRQLVESIRAGQITGKSREEQEGKTVIYWAGYLAHYLADNTQPQHATIDYKSQSYFAGPSTRSPNVHAEVEYRMCDDATQEFPELRKEVWALFVKQLDDKNDPVVVSKDLWQGSLEVSLRSYDALPLIGLAAMHATKQGGTPEHPTGPAGAFDTEQFFRFKGQCFGREMTVLEMKAIQTAWAVKRIEKTFRQAWDEAATTSLPQR